MLTLSLKEFQGRRLLEGLPRQVFGTCARNRKTLRRWQTGQTEPFCNALHPASPCLYSRPGLTSEAGRLCRQETSYWTRKSVFHGFHGRNIAITRVRTRPRKLFSGRSMITPKRNYSVLSAATSRISFEATCLSAQGYDPSSARPSTKGSLGRNPSRRLSCLFVSLVSHHSHVN